MNVVVALEQRFLRTPDGRVWTQAMFAYDFWTRYLDVFDRVRIVARVLDVPEPPADWVQADGPDVDVAAVPYYIGPGQFLKKALPVRRAARASVRPDDAIILRVESIIANCMEPVLQRTGQPYAVEVTGDPYDSLAPGSIRHPLRPFFRWWYPRQMRRQCHHAVAAAYVTKEALQRRYPCPHYSVGVSDVELPAEAFAAAPRPMRAPDSPTTLITVGTQDQLYKAPDILIDAVGACVRDGLDLHLVLVGDGKHRPELEARAAAQGLGKRVRFLGQLTAGAAVRAQLDAADLFVLPSYQEGLPRALVEAMARGLPAIGSTVGGFPELLPTEYLVQPGNVAALAAMIRTVVTDPAPMAEMSARNMQKADEYRDELLDGQRRAFYQFVREQTEAWQARDARGVHAPVLGRA